MTQGRRRQILIVLIGGTLLNAGVYGAYTLPRSLAERRLAARRDVMREEVARQRAQVAALRAQTDAVRSNVADAQRFYGEVITPKSASLVPVLKEIEGMAREGGLHAGGANYNTEAVKGAPLDRFEITMPVSGTYHQLANFVDRVEQSQHFLTFDEVKVQSGQERPLMNVTMSCYFRSGRPGGVKAR